MKVEISRPIVHFYSATKIDLPNRNQNYHEIFSFEGRGDFINAVFRFNSDRIEFKAEIDGRVVTEIMLDDFNDFLGYRGDNSPAITKTPFNYNRDRNAFIIDFGTLVEFRESIKFYARADSSSNGRDLLDHQVIYTTLEDS